MPNVCHKWRRATAAILLALLAMPALAMEEIIVPGTRPGFDPWDDWFFFQQPQFPAWWEFYAMMNGFGGSSQTAPTNTDQGAQGAENPCENVGSTPIQQTGNPVVISTGNKVLQDVDFITAGEHPLAMVRTYQSASQGSFLTRWRSSFDYNLRFGYSDATSCERWQEQYSSACNPPAGQTLTSIKARRPDGALYSFTWKNGRWEDGKPNSINWVESVGSNWVLHTEGSDTETYFASGVVQSIADAHGVAWTFNYSGVTGLTNVSHPSGRSVWFTWEWDSVAGHYRIKSLYDPNNYQYQYTYYSNAMLKSVIYPNGNERKYLIEVPSQPTNITGITLQGTRLTNYAYLSDNRVQYSEQVGPFDRTDFSYGTGQTANSQLTRAGGEVANYQYADDGQGGKRLVSISRSGVTGCPNATAYTYYDANGFTDYTLDWNGNRTEYLYNSKGQLLEQIDGAQDANNQRQTVYEWDTNSAFNRIRRVQRSGGYAYAPKDEVVYDWYGPTDPAKNRLKSVTKYNRASFGVPNQERKITYTYTMYASNLPATVVIDGPLPGTGDAVTYAYNSAGYLTSTTNSLGHATTYASYNNWGRPVWVTDENGILTTFGYDNRSRISSKQLTVEGVSRSTTYSNTDLNNQPLQMVRADGLTEWYTYKIPGMPYTKSFTQTFDQPYIEYSYDPNMKMTRQMTKKVVFGLPPGCSYAGQFPWCVYGMTETDYAISNYGRDQLGRLTSQTGQNGQSTTFTYDNNGNLKTQTVTATPNRVTTFDYSVHDELIRITDPLNGITEFTYDFLGHVKATKDPKGNFTYYNWDGLHNLIRIVSPDTGTTTFTYDESGSRTSMTRQDGSQTFYGYDSLGRLTSITAAGQQQTFTYDSCTRGIGRLCSSTDPSGTTVANTYNEAGELASQTSTIAGTAYPVTYTHNKMGNVTSITYPGGNKAVYTYGGTEGRITTVQAVISGVTSTIASGITYIPYGGPSQWTYGNSILRGLFYDLDQRLTTVNATYSTTNFQRLIYNYSTANEISQKQDLVNGTLTQSFGFDALSQLTNATSGVSGIGNQSWTFDANGNRDSHTWNSLVDDYIPPTTNNQITQINGSRAKTLGYNANGNLSSKTGFGGNFTYAYDPFNRLTTVTAASATTYSYNARNQRVRKTGAAGNFNYLHSPTGELLGETAAGATPLSTQYIWFAGQPIAMIRNNTIYYIATDHLGRPEVVTNQARTVVWRASNLSHDRLVSTDTVGGLNLGFPGQYYDAESSLWYNLNRYYDSSTGRYIQSDQVGLMGGLNTYAYTANNPIGLVDTNGLWSFTLEYYRPLGGAIIVGRSETNGGWFGAIRVGVGIGGGFEIDFLDSNPAQEASIANGTCSAAGVGSGVFGNVGGNIGPVAAGLEAQVGAYKDQYSGFYGDFGPEASLGTSWGIRGSASIGFEQSGWARP